MEPSQGIQTERMPLFSVRYVDAVTRPTEAGGQDGRNGRKGRMVRENKQEERPTEHPQYLQLD